MVFLFQGKTEGVQTLQALKFFFDIEEKAVFAFPCEAVFKTQHHVIESDYVNTSASTDQKPVGKRIVY